MKTLHRLVFLSTLVLMIIAGQAHAGGNTLGSRAPLTADQDVLFTSGGQVELTLNAGVANAGRNYVLLGGFSGTNPGYTLPGGGILKINWDNMTTYIWNHINNANFVNFSGTLDAGGGATALLDTLGPLPPSIQTGWTLSFAFTTTGPYDFQSNAVGVLIDDPPTTVYVDDSNTTGFEDGSMAHPFTTIMEGVNAASNGERVLVDDSGVVYAEAVFLKDDVLLEGSNWDVSDGTVRPQIRAPGASADPSVSGSGVTGATITGFDILPGGMYPYYVHFVTLLNCVDVTLSDCYFNGDETPATMVGVYLSGCSGVTISYCHFDQIHGPNPGTTGDSYFCILGDTSPDLEIHNVRMNDIGTNPDPNGHVVDAVSLTDCHNAVIHNNLVYRIVVDSSGGSAGLVTGFKLKDCSDPLLYNNTVDHLDTTANYFINQCFGYFLDDCPNAVFVNNLATNIISSGFPPPLDRGIQGVTSSLPCNFTLTWGVSAAYYGTAYANAYCVSADPLYVDPQNGDHDLAGGSGGQLGYPYLVDWDDPGKPSGDPGNGNIERRTRMGCHGGPKGKTVGLFTPH